MTARFWTVSTSPDDARVIDLGHHGFITDLRTAVRTTQSGLVLACPATAEEIDAVVLPELVLCSDDQL